MRLARRVVVVVAVSAVGAGVSVAPQALAAAVESYVVVFQDTVGNPQAVANEHSRRHGADLAHTYSHALKGYSARIPSNRVDSIRSDPRVAYVEADRVMKANAQSIPWGISKVGATVSSTLAGNGSGAVGNVNVYVIDTGVYAHPDLNLVRHVNYAGGKNTDCHGHGTHVAGTIAAKDNSSYVVGAVPGAPLTGVKVLGCNGSGWTSNIIKGIDWVTTNAQKPAVANMSLGGGVSQALDTAVVGSAASGVLYALAAGNAGANACNSSPARAGAGTDNGIVTVAATDSSDKEASWSNYGSCVDIWAPGVSILSTRKGGGTTTMSGTSMASPHVAGGGALYLSSHTADAPSTVEAALKLGAQAPGSLSKDGRSILREYVGLL